jgi:hypothetical protein
MVLGISVETLKCLFPSNTSEAEGTGSGMEEFNRIRPVGLLKALEASESR